MSFITFAKAMLGDELAEIGFERKSGVDWYKLIDNCILLRLRFRKLYGFTEVTFGIQSMFSKLGYSEILNNNLMDYGPRTNGNVDLESIVLAYADENTPGGQEIIEKGKRMFSVVKPVLASVHDLQSCFDAMQQASYMALSKGFSNILGREYTIDEHAVYPYEDGFFILCRLGKYAEAAEYLRRGLVNYRIQHVKTANDESLIKHETEKLQPYIDMVEHGEYQKLNEIMRKNYNDGCDFVEGKYKIKIDRLKVSFD